ncbi:hypothetical protein M8007_00235 [Dinoroseobacter shibae]|uniref:hypothetical protein n=1 Tax=Dinoroseobacter shibae TaxID=215813 RepID=UPI0012FEA992|nr:hypothetical protein [Dinoroseobacter shibae]URF46777.1 hypothetical protein M8008_00235 [Dinoroseobacter shibae]URF51088.1 hypothetical protein M8007_00235 [Dinoroseobacter shibae]
MLHFLRQEAVRDGCNTLPHIDALLEMRGVNPSALTVPRKTPKAFKKGELRRLVLQALREGPKTGRQIADYVEAARSDLPKGAAYKRVYVCLAQLRGHGMVKRKNGEWFAGECE